MTTFQFYSAVDGPSIVTIEHQSDGTILWTEERRGVRHSVTTRDYPDASSEAADALNVLWRKMWP
jgi:hypothetical protein